MRIVLLAAFVFINIFSISSAEAQEVFEDYDQNPVFSYSGVSGTFDQMRIYSHDVTKVENEYWMYYSGVGNGNSVQIGLAKSSDGINWSRHSSEPIFKCADNSSVCGTNGNWSHFRVSVVSVEYTDNGFKMWFQGDNQNLNSVKRLGYATSSDGLNWVASETNPIFTAEEQTGIKYDSVLRTTEGYRLYYTDGIDVGYYYVESTDGINWPGPAVKIGDERVHTVDKIGQKYVAIVDTKIVVSDDGKQFDFADHTAVIESNPGPDEAKVAFLLEDGIIKSWRVNYEGNVIWSFGNFSINYATLAESDLYEVTEEKYPLYTQIESPYPSIEETKEWADDKFARSDDESAINKCETIAQCGCAITSLVMMARSEGLKFGVDGKDINPGTLNTWLIENNGYDKQGNVFWSRAIDYFGQMEEDKIVTPFNLIDHKVIKINESVEDGNYVLGFSASNGHYIYLTGISGSGFTVRDPHWYNTETTNDSLDLKNFVQDYNDKINRGVAYSFASSSIQKGIIEVTLNSPAELLLVDDLGNETGYKEDGVLVENIEKSSYVQDEFIADQETEIDANHHVAKRLLKTDAVGKYELQVIGTGAGEYTITLSVKTNSGDNVFNEIVGETELGQIDEFLIDMEDGSVDEIEDSEDDLILDRDRFIALVVAATEGKHRVIERFFVRSANRIFDSIEKDKNKLAQLQLKVFGKLLRAKKISDEDLDEAVKDLTAALKVK